MNSKIVILLCFLVFKSWETNTLDLVLSGDVLTHSTVLSDSIFHHQKINEKMMSSVKTPILEMGAEEHINFKLNTEEIKGRVLGRKKNKRKR